MFPQVKAVAPPGLDDGQVRAWFERTASKAQVDVIYSLKTDRIKVIDDF